MHRNALGGWGWGGITSFQRQSDCIMWWETVSHHIIWTAECLVECWADLLPAAFEELVPALRPSFAGGCPSITIHTWNKGNTTYASKFKLFVCIWQLVGVGPLFLILFIVQLELLEVLIFCECHVACHIHSMWNTIKTGTGCKISDPVGYWHCVAQTTEIDTLVLSFHRRFVQSFKWKGNWGTCQVRFTKSQATKLR